MIEMVQYNYIRFLYFNKHESEQAIAKELGISRTTVRRAMTIFTARRIWRKIGNILTVISHKRKFVRNIQSILAHRWLKKYKESGYDDSVFSVSRGMPESIISDY